MIISYEGQQYPFDFDDITVQQGLAIEKFMDCSFAEWGERLRAGGDLRARKVLGWLILHPDPDGQDLSVLVKAIEDTNFKMVPFGNALEAAYEAEAAASAPAEEVPTGAASNGRSPAGSSPASSPPSSEEISR